MHNTSIPFTHYLGTVSMLLQAIFQKYNFLFNLRYLYIKLFIKKHATSHRGSDVPYKAKADIRNRTLYLPTLNGTLGHDRSS